MVLSTKEGKRERKKDRKEGGEETELASLQWKREIHDDKWKRLGQEVHKGGCGGG